MTNNVLDIQANDTIFTARYPEISKLWEEHERAHWIPDEADMRIDIEQWKNGTIPESEKAFIKMILRLFTQADKDVEEAYVDKLLPNFKSTEVRQMLLSFAARESTHQIGYKRLNDTLGYDTPAFMEEFLAYSSMKDKHEFMIAKASMDTPLDIARYLAKQVLMEGVNLFASFAMLLSFSRKGKLPGMVSVNKWSIADETLHVRGLTALFKRFLEQHPDIINNYFKADIYETARTVVGLEDAFIQLCFSVGSSSAITEEEARQYIRYVCDFRMQMMGFKAQFGVKDNPIPWIDEVTGNTLNNFFEVTGVEYSKGNLSGAWVY